MAQLESGQALAKIPYTTTRHLVVVVIETGLRGGDACNLPFNPVLADSSGWPCLRFEAVKVRAEQLIPLSAKAAAAIAAQQEYVREHWPAGSPWLFPGMTGNDDGSKPYSHRTFAQQLEHWQRVIGLRDEAGQPVTVTGHQFRHTLGTRLINSGVPQHVVQKLLGHASPHMTSHYAKIHDTTIREAFDRYQAQRVNISGEPISYDPGAPTASAEWVKHNLNRIRDSLPNGYCARPAQQDCPHPNACLTCPDFQTTPVFLQIHRRQAATNRRLIAQADANGQQRLAGTCAASRTAWTGSSPPSKRSATTGSAMRRADNSAFLAQANARRHQAALSAAHHAIQQLQRQGRPVTFSTVAQSPASPVDGSTAKTRSATSSASTGAQATSHPAHRTTRNRRLAPPAARCRPRRDHPPASREPLPPRATRPPPRPPANPARQPRPSRAAMTPATTPHPAAAATCLRRKNGRLPGIICRRLQITAVRGGVGGRGEHWLPRRTD